MPAIDFQNVVLALRGVAVTVPELPTTDKWQFGNVQFDNPTSSTWVREVFIIGTEVPATNSYTRAEGTYIIQIFVPVGTGMKNARDAGKALWEAFSAPSNISSNGVEVSLYRAQRMEEPAHEDYANVTVEVFWRVYASN